MNLKMQSYIETVCSFVKSQEVHCDIQSELENHIIESVDEYKASGFSEDEAFKKALALMGDPNILGKQLNQVHKPRIDWKTISLVTTLIGIGLANLYSMQRSLLLSEDAVFRQLLSVGLGIIVMISFMFFDYRKIMKYSMGLLLGTLGMMMLVFFQGSLMNGIPIYSFGFIRINIWDVSPALLVIALCGIFTNRKWGKKYDIGYLLVLYLLPIFLYLMVPTIISAVLYTICYFVLLIMCGIVKKRYVFILSMFIGGGALFILKTSFHHWERFMAFLYPFQYADTVGYQTVKSIEIISDAGLWGHGFGAELRLLGSVENHFVLTYIIYIFGWVLGGAMIVLFILLIARLFYTVKDSREMYGKSLIIGLGSLFILQSIWNIAMVVGLAPAASVNLPFISYGGIGFIFQVAAIGLILSVYRRKNMISSRHIIG